MDDYASSNNGWVEMYLNALLGEGLSKEYEQGVQHDHGPDTKALYFLNKAIEVDESAIVTSWRRAQIPTANMVDPEATRREYQAWRIWGMKRTRLEEERDRHSIESEPGTPMGTTPRPIEGAITRTTSASDTTSVPGSSWDPKRPDSLSGASVGNKALGSLAPVRTEVSNEPTAADALPSPGTGRSAASEAPAPNPFAGRVDKLHIVLASMHGLVRGDNMELGKDADTGGQVKYVVELAKTMSHHPMVHRVDLLTRLIEDPAVDDSYGVEEECMHEGQGEFGGAYIIRVKAGDPSVYLPKESLWPHVREFADYALQYIAGVQRRMHEASEPCNLYAVHGHYADAGEAAALIAHTLGCAMVLTGHSLGRNKLDHLKRQGTISGEQIEETYKISRRIEGEERALDAALMVITSTQQEVDLQWGLYDGYRENVAKALRLRPITGHSMPVMYVCPPGLDFSSLKVELPADPMQLFVETRKSMSALDKTLHAKFAPPSEGGPLQPREDPVGGDSPQASAAAGEPESLGNDRAVHFADSKSDGGGGERRLSGGDKRSSSGAGLMSQSLSLSRSSRHGSRTNLSGVGSQVGLDTLGERGHSSGEPDIWRAINRFLRNPAKPVILAMSRPDAKKNITTLVQAFGENDTLRNLANLVLIMGNRGDLDSLAKGSQQVLTQVLKLIDKYDLYGSVAYPKAHKQADISDIYLLAKKTTGVFVNIALQEPFGLTLIEAAVHGAPIVATTHGGPVDIIKTLKNGKLVEPTDSAAVSAAILDIVLNKDTWHRYSTNGNRNILAYSWPSHCIKYLEELERLIQGEGEPGAHGHGHGTGRLQRRLPSRLSFEQVGHDLGDTMTGELRKVGSNMSLPITGLTQAVDDLTIRPEHTREAPAGSSSMAQNEMAATGQGIRLRSRKRLVFAMLDSTLDVALLAEELQGVIDRNDGSLAVGLLTVLTLSEIKEELQKAGIRPESLDFLVCNCGAYVFCLADDGATFVTDEEWERKIAYRWDKKLVTRTLTRMQVARAPSGKGRDKTGDVLRMLTAADGVDFNDGNGPYHVLLALDPKEASPLQRLDNAALLSKVRKRTRHAGVRVNLTLQLAPGETGAGGETQSVLHATPLRASRALALRHIMQTHGFELSAALFLCTPASVHKKGDKGAAGTLLGTLCSDMAALVEGAQRVVVVPPKTQVEVSTRAENEAPEKAAQAGKRNAAAFERLKVSLEPYSEARVAVLDDASELPDTLQKLLKPQ